jgi:hypothetical protein
MACVEQVTLFFQLSRRTVTLAFYFIDLLLSIPSSAWKWNVSQWLFAFSFPDLIPFNFIVCLEMSSNGRAQTCGCCDVRSILWWHTAHDLCINWKKAQRILPNLLKCQAPATATALRLQARLIYVLTLHEASKLAPVHGENIGESVDLSTSYIEVFCKVPFCPCWSDATSVGSALWVFSRLICFYILTVW